jgi:hypothetical protein
MVRRSVENHTMNARECATGCSVLLLAHMGCVCFPLSILLLCYMFPLSWIPLLHIVYIYHTYPGVHLSPLYRD